MNRIAALLLTCSLLTSPASRAEWAIADRGCEVELPHSGRFAVWSGQCIDGKASGNGIVKAIYDTRIEGEFRKGSPFNATGRFIRELPDGSREMMRITYVRGKSKIEPIVDLSGRTRIGMTPLTGFWDWQSPDGKCNVKHEYRSNGYFVVGSGDLRVTGVAQLYAVDGSPDLMEMISTSTGHNRERDCYGKSPDHVGDTERFFLRLDGDQKLWRCTAAEQTACTAMAARGEPYLHPPGERNLITSAAGRASGGINTANSRHGYGSDAGSMGAADPKANPSERIEIVFDRNKGALYALYGRALRDNPKLEGKFVVEIDIDVSGIVTAVRVKSSELNDPELEKKLVARIRLIKFGPLEKAITVTKRIDFFPAA